MMAMVTMVTMMTMTVTMKKYEESDETVGDGEGGDQVVRCRVQTPLLIHKFIKVNLIFRFKEDLEALIYFQKHPIGTL